MFKKNTSVLKKGMTPKEWDKFNKENCRKPPIPPSRKAPTLAGYKKKAERAAKQRGYQEE